jgi:hypothetical protein
VQREGNEEGGGFLVIMLWSIQRVLHYKIMASGGGKGDAGRGISACSSLRHMRAVRSDAIYELEDQIISSLAQDNVATNGG